jgi:Mn2+/Fe2+ NRAMP family transporter
MLTKIQHYWKGILTAIGEAATLAVAFNVHGRWVTYLVAVATVLGVVAVRNKPKPAKP